jgi:hypothetical protein
MKKTLVLISCMSFLGACLALADDALTPTTGILVKVEKVTTTLNVEPGMIATMHVEAIATFGNECLAPASAKELVTSTNESKDGLFYDISLLQLHTDRVCVTMYKPVQRTIVVADVRITDGQPLPLILPQFIVNRVKQDSTENAQ